MIRPALLSLLLPTSSAALFLSAGLAIGADHAPYRAPCPTGKARVFVSFELTARPGLDRHAFYCLAPSATLPENMGALGRDIGREHGAPIAITGYKTMVDFDPKPGPRAR